MWLGEKMYNLESNSEEIYFINKVIGKLFLELEEIYRFRF